MRNVAHLITDSGILLFLEGKQFEVAQDHPNFKAIKAKLEVRDYSDIEVLLDIRASVKKWLGVNPRFSLTNDLLALDGVTFTNAVTDKVLRMIDAGNDPQALFNFLTKVRLNPSNVAQKELLLFCVANGFMIHADGDLLAYKAVNPNYTDLHSGTVSYKLASLMTPDELNAVRSGGLQGKERNVSVTVENGVTVVSMPRNAVDDERDRTCSNGLHFAAHEYAQMFGGGRGHMLLLKLSPADVVSIPSDYKNQKGRCSKFAVVAVLASAAPLPEKEVFDDRDWGGEWDEEDDDEVEFCIDCGCEIPNDYCDNCDRNPY